MPDIGEFKSNSYKSREKPPEKKVEKVVTTPVKRKKQSELKKFADAFISEDAPKIKNYVLWDVLIPAVKKLIWDIITNSADMMLYGETGRSKSRSSLSRPSYGASFKRSEDREPKRYLGGERSVYRYDDIIFETRGEAETVLDTLDELVEQFGIASVAEFYEAAGEQANHTDWKYGWTSLQSAYVVHVRDGYLLKLPKALPIDR